VVGYVSTPLGNVGIGTTAPGQKLTVAGNLSAHGSLSATGAGYNYFNSRVGIGTTSPTAKLHIDDNATAGTGLLVTGGGIGGPLATFTRDVGG
jgi:hypothetical protein